MSYRRDQYGNNAKFVARITLVKGIPFYGFHVGYRFFLKIYMFNPVVMTRLADLLQQGVILRRKFQPYEAHLQYLLQFMVDYNVYGCDYLDASKVAFRSPVPDYEDVINSPHTWHSQSILPESITTDPSLPRVSHCSIEVDICLQHIVNRKMVEERALHHDFIERNAPIPADLKLVYSMAGLWRDESKRRQRQMPRQKQGQSPFPPEVMVTMSADARDSQPQGWIHEDEYRDQVNHLIKTELSDLGSQPLEFDSFAKSAGLECDVQTALDSVEDLYPSNLMPVLGLPSNPSQVANETQSSIDVDEKKILQHLTPGDDFFPEDSDEEALRELIQAEVPATREEHQINDVATSGSTGNLGGSNEQQIISSSSLLPGLCLSILKTGELPNINVSQELLDAAEDEGLVGRAPKLSQFGSSQKAHLKRPGTSILDHGASPHKRIKSKSPSSPTAAVATADGPLSPNKPQSRFHQPKSSASNKLSSPSPRGRMSNTNFSNQTLNYAIVKDQNDPNTKPRLTQRSQLSSSQTSDTPRSDKHVTFDDSLASQDRKQSDSQKLGVSWIPTSSLADEDSKASKITTAIGDVTSQPCYFFAIMPPSVKECLAMKDQNRPDVVYQDAFYSKEKDVPERNREYAGREFHLESNTVPFLPAFDIDGSSPASYGVKEETNLLGRSALEQEQSRHRRECSLKSLDFAIAPPSVEEVSTWLMKELQRYDVERGIPQVRLPTESKQVQSQIDGPTPKNKHGFRYTQKNEHTSVEHEVQYMSTMSVEIHVNTRGKFVPNPEEDEVQCIFWACKSDETVRNSQNPPDAVQSGTIILCTDGKLAHKLRKSSKSDIVEESGELDLLVRLVEIVRTYDPDVLTGYEVHGSSWGYLIERARCKYDYNLCDEFSRMKTDSHGRFGKQSDRWGFNTTSTIRVTGRHMINIWRAMRGELNLLQYTMENVTWHVLHRRIPHYSWKTLTAWYRSGKNNDLSKLLSYYRIRTLIDIEILESNELIARTSEQARLLGVDFFSVFSRGSQFKVESIMFRIAKPENFIFVSPNRKQVGGQNALECLPLVMEPQSAFYTSPVLVLDFQSLYPSVMIAYNYCYSTFLGRIANWRGTSKMGFTEYKRQQGLLALLKDYINIAPNGMMYAKTEIRKSLLAKMLTEILETRVMVKSGMKNDKDDKVLQQLLNNRQLALKLLANVTYGYTSASFSGRMPCSEIADSIVQTGRETLERATAYIHSVERWGAEVVYGDTDSLFVYLKGRTKDQAFDIGNEIAQAITDMNPRPVKLKFEKVYHPCVLLTKKRYVGYKYESKRQETPEFDAKGIETVRRDGTPAEQKIEEKALKMLFETADLSQIKEYFQRQCDKIMRGAVSVQDFCFAKEVRLGTYSDKGPPPAGALISTRKMLEDARAEPQYGERVPYVVITGAPGARLIDRCVAPEDLLNNPHWQLDAEYYISKNLIPPLERIFNLVGANVRQWYDEMPKVQRIHATASHHPGSRKMTLESYMRSTHCLVCNSKFAEEGQVLCPACRANTPASLLALQTRLTVEERSFQDILSVCRTCSGLAPLDDVRCDSKDCPVFWTRMKQRTRVAGVRATAGPVIRALAESGNSRAALEW